MIIDQKNSVAIYPGTFDPITNGHFDIVKRASRLFQKLIVGVSFNSQKTTMFNFEERQKLVKDAVSNIANATVKGFSGLLVDFAKSENAFIIVRGLRAISDFDLELQLAEMNKKLDPRMETTILVTSTEYLYVSSSVIREIAMLGGKIAELVPRNVNQALKAKFKQQK